MRAACWNTQTLDVIAACDVCNEGDQVRSPQVASERSLRVANTLFCFENRSAFSACASPEGHKTQMFCLRQTTFLLAIDQLVHTWTLQRRPFAFARSSVAVAAVCDGSRLRLSGAVASMCVPKAAPARTLVARRRALCWSKSRDVWLELQFRQRPRSRSTFGHPRLTGGGLTARVHTGG
eukprot:6200725-Pleurochrysis_carterae.AAC.1